MAITVYSTENCVQCKNTYMLLDKAGIEYASVDLKADPNAMAILDKYNFQAAPVVIIESEDGVEDAWCGFRTDKIKGLIAARV